MSWPMDGQDDIYFIAVQKESMQMDKNQEGTQKRSAIWGRSVNRWHLLFAFLLFTYFIALLLSKKQIVLPF